MSSGLPENLLLQNLRIILMLLMYEFEIFELFSCMIFKACFTIELSAFKGKGKGKGNSAIVIVIATATVTVTVTVTVIVIV